MAGRRLLVSADGSCLGNPGPGGWAWALAEDCWCAGGVKRTTNNLMELRAVYEALNTLPARIPLTLETDSQYVINVFTKWLSGWKRKGWKTSSGGAVANRAGIEAIESLLVGRDVVWEHVRGHTGQLLNEVVDSRARAAAESIRSGRPPVLHSPKPVEEFLGGEGWLATSVSG